MFKEGPISSQFERKISSKYHFLKSGLWAKFGTLTNRRFIFLISLAQVKQSANNESIVFRREAVELEDSFFLNLMDGKQSREKAN